MVGDALVSRSACVRLAMDNSATKLNYTRRGEIEGKQIYIYDHLVAPQVIAQIKQALDQNAFMRTEIARPDTEEHRHWVRNMPIEAAQKLPLFKPTVIAAQPFCQSGKQFRLYRAYTNCSNFGDMLFTHTDCKPGAGEITALWYICIEWDHEWGGETLFFNSENDAEFVAAPRPGRLVIFDGDITHCGRPPNRICYENRYTFALKLEQVAV